MESIAKNVPPARSRGPSQRFSGKACSDAARQDLLRRFTPTPHSTDLQLMHRTVRLETNSEAMLTLALKFFERHQHGKSGPPEFLWRIVCESDPRVQTLDVQLSAFSDSGLRYVNIGQRGFLAVDTERREACGFLADPFVDGVREIKNSRPLDILFCLTAPLLGLTALAGGCVGVKDRGALVFGIPNSGKTTACYLAAKLGMEFHADQTVFLDTDRDVLHAWGDLFPAVFRPETLEFLPELRQSTHRSTRGELSFFYLDKAPFQSASALPVTPVCSFFLERGVTGKPHLTEIRPEDAVSRLRGCLLFREDERFDKQVAAALNALASRPIYNLQYGNDPKTATSIIEKMLR